MAFDRAGPDDAEYDEFLKYSANLGVDHVRHGHGADLHTLYVFVRNESEEKHRAITKLARTLWPNLSVVLLVAIPMKRRR